MAGNDDLHPLLRNINETIGKLREDVQKLTGEVKKIPKLVEQGFENLRDAVHESIQAQAEMKVMEHMMEVNAVKPQLEAEKEQVMSVQNELDERLDNISERYQRKHTELDERAQERVRELGSHIFTIEEDQFGAGIEDPFTKQVTPMWRNLQAHNDKINEQRETEVVGTTESVVDEIDTFLERKDELVDQIDDHLLEPDSVPMETAEPTEFQIPYYVVEYEINGVTDKMVVPPSEITPARTHDRWCSATLEPVQGADSLVDGTTSIDTASASTETIDRSAVISQLQGYETDTSFGPSYTEALDDTIPDRVEITIEGGEE